VVDVTVALPAVFTVILNTNRREDTLACLASLETCSYENHHVIVLDNASTDGSLEAIRTKYPCARTIELDNNLGYAGNNNVGIQAALDQGADWIYVLNEDTIVDPDCIARLVQAGETDARIGENLPDGGRWHVLSNGRRRPGRCGRRAICLQPRLFKV
jgi:hypothetical protein